MKPAVALLLFVACSGQAPQQPVPARKDLLQENRNAVKLEDRDIDLYVQRQGLSVERSGTGVRHMLLRDTPGASVRAGQWAQVRYRMELLNGDTAYTSSNEGPESFLVEEDDVESGLHEAIQRLSPGDSAIIIIPSYRAHGLIGDQDQVPPRTSVVYRIGLVGIRN